MNKENHKILWNQNQPVYYQFIDRKAKETVVFIHGLFSTSAIFRHFTEQIDKNIILIELRGITFSKIKKPYLQNYVKDVQLILKKEGIKKATLVGYSLGCSIANAFAETCCFMVKKLILLAPVNRSIKEIGKRNMIRTLTSGLGQDFFQKWKSYLSLHRGIPKWRIFNLFNFRILKEAYAKISFTRKCRVIILNGINDTFFDFRDIQLKCPNIVHRTMNNIDHFLFISKKRIRTIARILTFHINEDPHL